MPLIREFKDSTGRGVEWLAPAKVNVFLNILARRPNGYHDLESLMVPLHFGDLLEIRLHPEKRAGEVTLQIENSDLPADDNNLAVRAARLFGEHLKKPLCAVSILLKKITPVAAGLGGGSSDAAAVLLALNHLMEAPFELQTLQKMSVVLGADVPFFLFEKTCLARGIGEILTPCDVSRRYWFVLVNPGFAVSTKWVYENLNLAQTAKALGKIPTVSQRDISHVDWATLLWNDLERVTLIRHPELEDIKQNLRELGANGSLMSGSGPTVFGIFPDSVTSEKASQTLTAKNSHWKVFVTHNI